MGSGMTIVRSRAGGGFTLVELLVAIAMLAIVVSFAVPAYSDFVMRKRASSGINDFLVDLSAARSEATRQRRNVVMCARGGAAETCDATTQSAACICDDQGQWENGWITFVDINGDGALSAASIDALLGVHPALASGVRFREASGDGSIAFNSRGALAGTVSRFALCINDDAGTQDDEDVLARARFVDVALTGRAVVSRAQASPGSASSACYVSPSS